MFALVTAIVVLYVTLLLYFLDLFWCCCKIVVKVGFALSASLSKPLCTPCDVCADDQERLFFNDITDCSEG